MAHPARSKLSSEISAGLNSAAGTNAILSGRLLGETTFHVDGALVGISNRKSKSLLAYLCLSETGSESRERIVGTLWSEAEPDRARASLRQAIYEVRSHLLAAGFVGFDSDNLTVRLDTSRVSCDVQEILSALEAACVHPQLLRREQASSALLEDLDSTDPAFCTWLQSQRELLRRRLVLGLETCLAKPKAGGADRKQLAAALLNLDPAHELAVRALMRIYQEERNPGAALDVYKRLWDYLDREFDIEPCPETQSLAAGIKLADDDRAGAAPPSPKSQLEPGEKPAEKPARARAVLAVLTGERKPALRAHVREWISRRQPTARVIERPDGGLIVDVEKTSEAARLAFALVSEPGLAALKAQAGDLSLGLHFGAGDARDGDETAVALAKLSDADHVIASEAARERLVEGLDATIQDLGFLRIPETADRARAFMLGPAAVTLVGTEPALQKMQPTIAIVPMLPTDHGQSNHVIPVLAAEELSNELSRSQMVDVISPLSSRRLAGRELSPDEIGKRLGADLSRARLLPGERSRRPVERGTGGRAYERHEMAAAYRSVVAVDREYQSRDRAHRAGVPFGPLRSAIALCLRGPPGHPRLLQAAVLRDCTDGPLDTQQLPSRARTSRHSQAARARCTTGPMPGSRRGTSARSARAGRPMPLQTARPRSSMPSSLSTATPTAPWPSPWRAGRTSMEAGASTLRSSACNSRSRSIIATRSRGS